MKVLLMIWNPVSTIYNPAMTIYFLCPYCDLSWLEPDGLRWAAFGNRYRSLASPPDYPRTIWSPPACLLIPLEVPLRLICRTVSTYIFVSYSFIFSVWLNILFKSLFFYYCHYSISDPGNVFQVFRSRSQVQQYIASLLNKHQTSQANFCLSIGFP